MSIFLVGADVNISDAANAALDYIVMTKWTATTTGTLTEIRVKVGDNCNVKVGVYADDAGAPATLLTSNQTGTACTVGWNTISISSINIVSGTDYWIAENNDASYVRYISTGGTSLYKAWAYATAFPSPPVDFSALTWECALAGWGNLPGGSGVKNRLLLGVGL